jgi:hypothetical protein
VDTIDRAVAVDERTVDIITKVPDPILPNKIISVYMMSKPWSEANNAARPQNTRAREETHTVRNTNGTGPFRLAAREPDVRTVMARNDAWWGWQQQQGEAADRQRHGDRLPARGQRRHAHRGAALGRGGLRARPALAGPQPAALRVGDEGAGRAGGAEPLHRLRHLPRRAASTAT